MAEQLRFMTPKEYLAFEKQAEQRHEYVNGVIIAMAGASRRHNLLTLAFASPLRTHLFKTNYFGQKIRNHRLITVFLGRHQWVYALSG